MAKNENMLLWVVLGGVLVFAFMGGDSGTNDNTGGNDNSGGSSIDLCDLVDGQASFTGQRMFLSGTALGAGEAVRVIKQNGDTVKDLGLINLNSGTLSTAPNGKYKLYYGENSSTYYTKAETYTAPCQDATDDRVGVLCTIDTTPSLTVYDENGQVQSGGATNSQALAASETVDMDVKIKISADQCFGAPGSGKKNAICFTYSTTYYDSVKANTGSIASVPRSISNLQPSGYETSCYEFDLLADTASQVLTVTVDADDTNDPVATALGSNITIYVEDIDYDINQDSLAEIIGFEDEDNNNLGDAIASNSANMTFT